MTPVTDIDVDPGTPWAGRGSAAGPWLAMIWLVFLVPALIDGWQDRDHLAGVVGTLATVAFGCLYLYTWRGARQSRMRLLVQPPVLVAVGYVAALTALGVVMVLCVGENGTAATVF